MNEAGTLSTRVDELEARLMYQEVTIETLNQTITAQWREIDALKRQLSELSDRLREAETASPQPPTERPPHY
jgi:SlyX protein